MKIIPILLSSVLILAGCASYPEQVRVADETSLVSFQATVKAGLTEGPARWSGVIAKVQNNSQNTRLEIVYFPSGTHGRPQTDKATEGRFVAYAKGFLDPMVYQPGKQITILGQLGRFEAGKVDQFQYSYPVINASAVYLWPKQQETTRVDVEPWPLWRAPYPYWGYGPAVRIRTTTPTGTTPTQGPADVSQNQGSNQR